MVVHVWCKRTSDVMLLTRHLECTAGSIAAICDDRPSLTINWGQTGSPGLLYEGSFVMNRPECVERLKYPRSVHKRLSLHGLRIEHTGSGGMIHQRYMIPVFHLKALTVYRLQREQLFVRPGAFIASIQEEVNEAENQRLKYLKRQAIRAIYALGLDFGIVELGLNHQGKAVIVHVDPAPQLTDRLGSLIAKAISEFADEQRFSVPFSEKSKLGDLDLELLIGMDPECIIVDSRGKVVSADRFYEKRGSIGCDSIVLPGRKVIYPLLEFRPQPQTVPDKLIDELKRLLQLSAPLFRQQQLNCLAGGMPRRGIALGGHLHFSGRPLDVRWLRALDLYLAVPLMLLEDSTTRRRRPRYGFLGDFRTKQHGGFEYRTLPSWIVDPDIASGVLYLAHIISNHYKELNTNLIDHYRLIKAYYEGNKQAVHSWITKLWQQLEKCSTYEWYRFRLQPFNKRLLEQRSWDEQQDIMRLWEMV